MTADSSITLRSSEQSSADAVADAKRQAAALGLRVVAIEKVEMQVAPQRPGEPGLRSWKVTLRVRKDS